MDLKEFLGTPYTTGKFETFLTERFYGLEISNSIYDDEELSPSEKKQIESYRYLGKVELDDGKEIGFFEFISASSSIENKRVGFNAVLKKLAKEYIFDGAIASFSHAKSDVWRLSFVGLEYDEGKAEPTNLKRYTYLLGEGVPNKTAYQQLNRLKYPEFNEIVEAFGVEKVSQEFFEKYKNLFEMLNDYLRENHYNEYFETDERLHAFTKKLLGRIVFLYFLQKKGWLAVAVDAEWGEGDRNFLSNALKTRKDKDFFKDFLKRVFFEALNLKREHDYCDITKSKMPFLNGGLFEKDEFDKLKNINLENRHFEKIFRTFNEYNFTVIEDSPDDKEVAIDPEMMGRVFENLLEEHYRKGKGAFYTPREVVHYMCQQSIVNYLVTHFDNRDKMVALVVNKESSDKYFSKNRDAITQKLYEMKILDPAIGSGAFPMGMLHEMVGVLTQLNGIEDADEVAKLKRLIIENSIYGVDIDPSAVEVAKLRFWLSLVVDEETPIPLPNLFYKIMVGNSLLETINGFDPLSKDHTVLFDASEDKIKEIGKLLHQFYNTNEHQAKVELKNTIEKGIDEILEEKLNEQEDIKRSQTENINLFNGLSKKQVEIIEESNETIRIVENIKKRPTTELFFYRIYFAEVLEQGGFDVVIGNPPYVRHEKIKALKPRLQKEKFYNPISKKEEKYVCFNGTADIYIYFFEKSFRLLREGGILSFITSNKYTRAKYGKQFRAFVLENTQIVEYVDFNGVKVFESATVDTSILTYKKDKKKNNSFIYCDINEKYKKGENLEQFVSKYGINYNQVDLKIESFLFTNAKELKIKNLIEKIGTKLSEWNIEIYRGIQTGNNRVFHVKEEIKNHFLNIDKKSKEILFPIVIGREIKKYSIESKNKYLIYTTDETNIQNYNAIYQYLLKYKEDLSSKREVRENKMQWYSIYRPARSHIDKFNLDKIIYPETTQNPDVFVLDKKGRYLDKTCFMIVGDNLKYINSVLNSRVMIFFMKQSIRQVGLGFQLSKIFVEQIPIKIISIKNQKPFEVLVDIILELKDKKDSKSNFFEQVIDVMVYELYFKEELKEKGFGIIDIVTKELLLDLSVEELYKKWTDSKHPIKYNVDFINSVEVVKTIEENL